MEYRQDLENPPYKSYRIPSKLESFLIMDILLPLVSLVGTPVIYILSKPWKNSRTSNKNQYRATESNLVKL